MPRGPRSLRQRKKQQTHLDLGRAAIELFREQGVDATTVEQICERAQYSINTFHRYFKTKENAAFYALPEFLTAFSADLDKPHLAGSFWNHLHSVCLNHVRRFDAPEIEIDTTVLTLWLTEPVLLRRYLEICGEWEQAIAQVAAHHEESDDPDASLRAQLVARCLIHSLIACFHVHVKTGTDLGALFDNAFAMLSDGFGTEQFDSARPVIGVADPRRGA